jgi:hypothetical protein
MTQTRFLTLALAAAPMLAMLATAVHALPLF